MKLFTHPACSLHDPAPVFGFAPERLRAVTAALRGANLPVLHEASGTQATVEDIELIHCRDFIDKVLAHIPEGTDVAFDFETYANCGTAVAALASAGLVLAATRDALAQDQSFSFCAVSPGGHHAEADNASGYCFFNHVALAAITAQKKWGCGRVAVLDFDAHHGNGTQSFFWSHPNLLYVSLHEDVGLSGFTDECGVSDNILNIPLPPRSGGEVFRQAILHQAFPKIKQFAPDFVLFSAGFDMHRSDPLSTLELEVADYGWLGATLREKAKTLGANRNVAVLEGGYHIESLAMCVAAFCKGLVVGR